MDSKEIKAISTQNTLLSILIIVNLILVSVALYLFMREEEPSPKYDSNTKTIQNSTQSAMSGVTDHATRTSSPDNNDNDKVKLEKPKAIAKDTLNVISQSLDDLGELTSTDAAYVEALNNMKKRVEAQIQLRPTISDVTARTAKQTDKKAIVDFFNKVDVSQQSVQDQGLSSKNPELATLIAQIVAETEHPTAIEKHDSEQVKDNYLKTLKTESLERANEMRTVKVVEGDSLWDIAERAYGNGHEYPRIFKANPGLKDPDRIEVGMLLRVPF